MNRRRCLAVLGGAMVALRARGILAYPTNMQPGVPYCDRCAPEVFPTFAKIGPHHAASRHGHQEDRGYDVFVLGSNPLTKVLDCYEAYQGETPEKSWVIRGYGRKRCPYCHGAYLKRFLPGFPVDLRLNRVPVR